MTPEAAAVFERMTPAEREAFAKLVGEAEDAGHEWARNPLAMVIWSAAQARRAGYRVPAVVEPADVMAKCL